MRFPECFTDAEGVQELQRELGKAISDSLTISKLWINAEIKEKADPVDLAEMQQLLK